MYITIQSKLAFLPDKNTSFLPYLKNNKERKHQNSLLILTMINKNVFKKKYLKQLVLIKDVRYLFIHKLRRYWLILWSVTFLSLKSLLWAQILTHLLLDLSFSLPFFVDCGIYQLYFLIPHSLLNSLWWRDYTILHRNCPRDKQRTPDYQHPQPFSARFYSAER